MGKPRRKAQRASARGGGRGQLRSVGGFAASGSPVDEIIDGGAQELLRDDDPLAAETWASHLLGMFETLAADALGGAEELPPFVELLLERCTQRRDRSALVVATALAAVATPGLQERARATAAALRRTAPGPPWLDQVGAARPTRGWLAVDVFGDQDALIVGFTQPGSQGEHALCVLVDHNLSGQAKDAWLGEDAPEVAAAWAANPDAHLQLEEAPVDAVLARLRDAMAAADLWDGDADLRTADFAEHRALVWARLRQAGHGSTDPTAAEEVSARARAAVVSAFAASAPGAVAGLARADVELLARALVDLRCTYEGRPLRWSPTVVGLLLTDLAPRKLLLDADLAAALPAVLRAFVRFAGERTGLAAEFVDEVLAAVAAAEPVYLALAGVARPAGVGAPTPARRVQAAPPDVVAGIEAAVLLSRFAALADFFGDGRKLTATGLPTLADGRALVALLGTADRVDEAIGERTFKTTSTAELSELSFWVAWALKAGVLRKAGGRLHATAAWRKLEGKPVQRWAKAMQALARVGPVGGFHARARPPFRQLAAFVDELTPDLLAALCSGQLTFDAGLDLVCEQAEEAFEWSGHWAAADIRRRSFGYYLDLLVAVLGWAGVVERVGATIDGRGVASRQQLVGGTLELTPAGRWWLAAD